MIIKVIFIITAIIMTTIKFDDIEHTGPFSQDYVNGFVFVYARINHHLDDEELNITVTGDCVKQYDTSTDSYLGCCPQGTGPELIGEGDITNEGQLEEYIYDFIEDELGFYIADRYMSAICFLQFETGGSERDRSFRDLFTFDDLEFIRGVRACASFFDHVHVDAVLDLHTFETL